MCPFFSIRNLYVSFLIGKIGCSSQLREERTAEMGPTRQKIATDLQTIPLI